MELYSGTARQVEIQQKVARECEWSKWTQGAAVAGHYMATDNPELFGWQNLLDHLDEDQIFGFRLVNMGDVMRLRQRLAGRGFRVDTEEVFVGVAADITPYCHDAIKAPLPAGLSLVNQDALISDFGIRQVQSCMTRNGLDAAPGAMLAGQNLRATLRAIQDSSGRVVATAFGHMVHNRHSDFEDYAWGGLICVDEAHRGQALGSVVNAHMILSCIDDLGAEAVYEHLDETDFTIRRVAELCGLVIDGALQCGVAVPGRVF